MILEMPEKIKYNHGISGMMKRQYNTAHGNMGTRTDREEYKLI